MQHFSEIFKVLSKEYAQNNISCINIAPGPINTDRTKELIEKCKKNLEKNINLIEKIRGTRRD